MNSKSPTKTKYIFAGGTGRSGTTIIADLLNAHPAMRSSLPIELKFTTNAGGLLDLIFGSQFAPEKDLPAIPFYSVRTRNERRVREQEKYEKNLKALEEKIQSTWWDIDAPPPHGRGLCSGISIDTYKDLFAAFKSSPHKKRQQAARDLLDGLIANQSNNQAEEFWIDSTPMNIPNAHRLIRLYPDALFINMVRDPRDTIASLLTKDWGPTTPLEGLEWYEKRIRSGHASLARIPKSQQLTISIEELVVHNSEETYNSLLAFLGVNDSPLMATFFQDHMKPASAQLDRWRNEITDPTFSVAFEAMVMRLNQDNIDFYVNDKH